MEKIEVIVYKQGNNWIQIKDGYETPLPGYFATKKSIRDYYASCGEQDGCLYKVIFA